jgi:membrane protease YdiL (CAAX protease family)
MTTGRGLWASRPWATGQARAPLGIRELFFWPLLAILVGAIIVKMAGLDLPAAVYECAFTVGWFLLALFTARRHGLGASGFFRRPRRRGDWAFMLIASLLLVAGLTSVFLTLYWLSLVAPDVMAEVLADDESDEPLEGWAKAVDVFGLTIAAPVAEEVVFRGVLLHLWSRRWGVRAGVIGTSMMFAALHAMEPISAFLFGVTMCVLYMRTETLLVPIATHILHNTVTLLGEIGDDGGPETLASFREDVIWAAPAFIISLAVLLVVLRKAGPNPWRLPSLGSRP